MSRYAWEVSLRRADGERQLKEAPSEKSELGESRQCYLRELSVMENDAVRRIKRTFSNLFRLCSISSSNQSEMCMKS